MLGEQINRSKGAICSYETDAQVPPFDVVISLASVLNVSLDYLAGLDPRNVLSTNGLTQEQIEVIQLILTEFSRSTSTSSVPSPQQIEIIQKLFLQFNRGKSNE